MIVNTYTVPTRVASRAYKLLSAEIGPPSKVKHFSLGCFFAQFGAFTLTAKPATEEEDIIFLSVYCHDEDDPTLIATERRLSSRINNMSGTNIDILNPFS